MINKLDKCLHPILADREGQLLLEKLQRQMRSHGLGYLVLNNPADIFYATGYIPFIPDNCFAVVPVEGEAILIASTIESADAYASTQGVDVREFLSWVFIDNGSEESRRDKGDIMDPNAPSKMILDILLNTPMEGKIGVQMGEISQNLYRKLMEKLPEDRVVDGSAALRDARIVKTPWEVNMLRLAAQQLEQILKHVAADLKPGMPAWKIDALFSYYASALNLEHGTMSRSHFFGPAAGPYFGLSGMPRGYVLQKGDLVKFDVGYRYFGYHSDIARTLAIGGEASDAAVEIYEVLYKANRLGVSMLKPGIAMKDVYQAVREDVEKSRFFPRYPRGHVGHSVGCGKYPEEYPTLGPATTHILEPGMVVCLECPYSAAGNVPVKGGFNLEDTHAILEDGIESFTHLPDSLFWNV